MYLGDHCEYLPPIVSGGSSGEPGFGPVHCALAVGIGLQWRQGGGNPPLDHVEAVGVRDDGRQPRLDAQPLAEEKFFVLGHRTNESSGRPSTLATRASEET